jgi:hypothetical protein
VAGGSGRMWRRCPRPRGGSVSALPRGAAIPDQANEAPRPSPNSNKARSHPCEVPGSGDCRQRRDVAASWSKRRRRPTTSSATPAATSR